MNGAEAMTQQGMEWMGQWQRTCVQSAIDWNMAAMQALHELQDAQNPLQLLSTGSGVLNRQLETFAAQTAGFMQLLFDSQLFINGLVFRKPEVTGLPTPALESNTAMLKAWGSAQDNWLNMTRRWIDAANAASIRR